MIFKKNYYLCYIILIPYLKSKHNFVVSKFTPKLFAYLDWLPK